MATNHGLFVMVDSDIDEEELKSFISRKRIKMKNNSRKRRTTDNKKQFSSVSSSPASLSPPDSHHSDDNTASASLTSLTSGSICSFQPEVKRKKQKTENGYVFTTFTDSEKLRSEHIECGVHPNNKKMKNSPTCLSDANAVKNKMPLPNAWYSVNTSHYIFSSDDDLSESETESKGKKMNKNSFQNKVFKSLNGKRNLKQSECMDRKQHNSPNSPKTQGPGKISSSCLTECGSCRDYVIPDVSEQESSEMSSYLALDCEFVGVGPKKTSSLGRCSIVDHRGEVIFDRFVKPPEKVTDYRTRWSGLRPRNLRFGVPLVAAQEMIAAIIKDKVVIGHAVHNDFHVMGVDHPVHLIRDTASCKLLREMANLPTNVCALRKLTCALLGRTIQKKEHCSVTDARACLDLFRLVRTRWEPILQAKLNRRAERQARDDVKVADGANGSGADPLLNSFFDDKYWPDHLFHDSV